MKIPIERLKEIAKKYELSHIILFAYHPASKQQYIVTYGKTIEESGQAADFGNSMKDSLGWPETLRQQPSRVIKLQKEIKKLKNELTELKQNILDITEKT